MPGLHHGNLCWGNRKSFYIYGEYPADVSMDIRRSESTTQSSPIYVPSNGYYGYHKVTTQQQILDESMDTIEEDIKDESNIRVQSMPNNMVCRKRQNNEPNFEHIKRRCQEASESSEAFHHRDGRTLSTYNLGYYML